MLKPLFSRLSRTKKDESSPFHGSTPNDYIRLVQRIIDGDSEAEAELVELFEPAVILIIRRIAQNPDLVEDFSQDTFLTVIRKIRHGDLQQPESLGGFIANTARYHTLEQLRSIRKRSINEAIEQAESVPDPSPNRLDQLLISERFDEVRSLVQQLKPRYRELLFRFYVNEEPKVSICNDLGMSSEQFDGVLHRARKRCKEIYLKENALEKKRKR